MTDIYEIIIGMLVSKPSLIEVALQEGVEEKHFGKDRPLRIFKALMEAKNDGVMADIQYLGLKCQDDVEFILECLGKAPLFENFGWYCGRLVLIWEIREKAVQLSSLCQTAMTLKHGDSDEKFKAMVKDLKDISWQLSEISDLSKDHTRHADEISRSALALIEQRYVERKTGKNSRIVLNLPKLDYRLGGGLEDESLYLVAARTGIGKSSFATYMMHEALKQGRNVYYFSNEMKSEALYYKMLARVAKIDSAAFLSGNLSEQDLSDINAAAAELAHLKYKINQVAGWDLTDLEAACIKYKQKGSLDIVFVDYLQQVENGSDTEYEQINKTTKRLKKLAGELKVPIIGMVQINRETERGGKSVMPTLANLKGSGSLEQDADAVMILHKDDPYSNDMALFLAKNRPTGSGILDLKYYATINDFREV